MTKASAIHIFIVVALQFAILTQPWSANVKFVFVAVLGIGLSFVVAAALRQIPAVRRIV